MTLFKQGHFELCPLSSLIRSKTEQHELNFKMGLDHLLGTDEPSESGGQKMGEFEQLAQRIAEELSRRQEEGIRSSEVPSLVDRCIGGEVVNCYPGVPSGCHEKLVLVALESKSYTTGGGHLSFRKAIEHLVRHMQGSCPGKTRIAVLITDTWDAKVIDFWRPNIEQIKGNSFLECYVISGGSVNQVTL